jgi:hypothetical protein
MQSIGKAAMIITQSENPKNSLYFMGAQVLHVLMNERFGLIDTLILYNKLNERLQENITFHKFLTTLDWLFIVGLIDISDQGDIKKCF